MSRFKWYRRLLGGSWYRLELDGYLFGKGHVPVYKWARSAFRPEEDIYCSILREEHY